MGNLKTSKDADICRMILRYLKENKTITVNAELFKEQGISCSYANSVLKRMTDDNLVTFTRGQPNVYALNMSNMDSVDYFLMHHAYRNDIINYLYDTGTSMSVIEMYYHFYEVENAVALKLFNQLCCILANEEILLKSGRGVNAYYTLNKNSNYQSYLKVKQ